jgi:diguanylate cyclase (GGDEF)-like protein
MAPHEEDTLLSLLNMPPPGAVRRWALKVVAGPLAGAVFDASKDLTVGRGPEASIRCNDPTVSRAHAAVRRRGELLFIEDLGSRNGTLVEGVRIAGATQLREGNRVDLGALGFRVVREDEHEILESKRLYDAATCDPVTGVFNRSYFDIQLACAVAGARDERKPLALLLVDVDHFKRVNDRFGHLTGDAALRAVGQAIASAVRPHDTVARWGGEEFVVLLPGTSALEAALIADRIRRKIEQLDMSALGMDRAVTVSIGVSCESDGAAWLPSELLGAADAAVYRAKAEGRNRVHVYSDESDFETQQVRKQSSVVRPTSAPPTETRVGAPHDDATMSLTRRA